MIVLILTLPILIASCRGVFPVACSPGSRDVFLDTSLGMDKWWEMYNPIHPSSQKCTTDNPLHNATDSMGLHYKLTQIRKKEGLYPAVVECQLARRARDDNQPPLSQQLHSAPILITITLGGGRKKLTKLNIFDWRKYWGLCCNFVVQVLN